MKKYKITIYLENFNFPYVINPRWETEVEALTEAEARKVALEKFKKVKSADIKYDELRIPMFEISYIYTAEMEHKNE